MIPPYGNIPEAFEVASGHLQAGRYQKAEDIYRGILAQTPDHIDALHFLAHALHQQGNNEAAVAYINKAIRVGAENPYLHNSKGILLNVMKQREAAIASFNKAVQLKPDYFDAYYNLAVVYCALGRCREGLNNFHAAMSIKPGNAESYLGFGDILSKRQQYEKAIECYREAIRLKPDYAEAYDSLGLSLRNIGNLKEAVESYRTALHYKPDFASAHSGLLSLLGYHVLSTPAETLREHKAWDSIHGGLEKQKTYSHSPTDPEKRLRIGYVSPDFYRHAVSYFIEPILEHHDRSQVEIFCYAEVHNPDEVTERLKGKADAWRSTVGLSDKQVADMIYEDGIDILVDLAGHSHADRTRLKVFTYKPAPVQATYLGYFTTTGLAAMDYWIVDRITAPDETVELAIETIYRLPRCCVCYQTPQDAPEVTVRKGSENQITFGCFNNIAKIGETAIDCWSQILHLLPGSHLVLKAGQFAGPAMRNHILDCFSQYKILPERLTLLPYTASLHDHFSLVWEDRYCP